MKEKINSMQNELKRAIRPMLIRGWNLNNEEKCYDVNISFAYFPKNLMGKILLELDMTLFYKVEELKIDFIVLNIL